MANTTPLRIALTVNAVFSMLCALVLIVFPATLAAWIGFNYPLVLQGVGAGLVLFAADIIHQVTRPRLSTWRALYTSMADFSWVLGSIVVLLFAHRYFSSFGIIAIAVIAVIVGVMGAWQLKHIGTAHAGTSYPYRHCLAVSVRVPAQQLWQVIADMGNIAEYMPSLRSSFLRDDANPGRGAVRLCEDRNGKRWGEECISYQDNHSFEVRFLSEAPDFPFPASTMYGGWQVEPIDQKSCEVVVW